MFLKSIKLLNFRNYSQVKYEFKTPTAVLLGNNASGKTNFLESIYFLASGKSPRADQDLEVVRKDQSFCKVEGAVIQNDSEQLSQSVSQNTSDSEHSDLEIHMQLIESRFRKRFLVNGIPKRVYDYHGHLAVVMFSPEDINLIIGSPSARRSHVDLTLSQVDKEYKKAIISYENIIIKKNRLLKAIKEGFSKPEELTFWSDNQLKYGATIVAKRKNFFESLNSTERKFGNFAFEFIESVLTPAKLMEYQPKEIEATVSLIGPHRDDFLFKLNGSDLAKYGSRGEQRTAVLDLKIAEISFMEQILGDRPILLLDDIFSELDESHKQHVLDITSLQQTVISVVEMDSFLRRKLKGAASLFIENGALVEVST